MASCPLDRLLGLLGAAVAEDALIDALYAVRAPRSCAAIIPAAKQLGDWRSRYSALMLDPEIPGYSAALGVLDRIADLPATDPVFSGRAAGKSLAWTPLRPLTGDSVIMELLLVQSSRSRVAELFEAAVVWVLGQAQQAHAVTLTRGDYAAYLRSDEGRLVDTLHGGRLYQAYLALRSLAEGTDQSDAKLREMVDLAREHASSRGATLALLAELSNWSPRSPVYAALLPRARDRLGLGEPKLEREIRRARRVLPAGIALLLRTAWRSELHVGSRRRRRSASGVFRGASLRPQIRHGERLTEVLQTVDEGDIHGGITASYYLPAGSRRRGEAEAAPFSDDAEETGLDEAFSIFLASSEDPIRGYYAAKSTQNAVEYDNARLVWSRWTLSTEALSAIDRLVSGADGRGLDERLDQEARLAIGLSLLTGRSLEQVAGAALHSGTGGADAAHPVAIALGDGTLHVWAGRPHLRKAASEDRSPLGLPRADTLSLPLPNSWLKLACQIVAKRRPRADVIAGRARDLLRLLPDELGIIPKGVRVALLRALDQITRGDLGVIAVITDGSEANARNVIHYAAYEKAQVEVWWREAAEALVGPLPQSAAMQQPLAAVGARDAFDLSAVAAYVAEIKRRIRAAEACGDWVRAYNLATAYLVYWLGLGLALRRTAKPLPQLVLADGWVWVGDKRRSDGSTDRLVPLTPALRSQIDAWLALASDLALVEPDLDPVVKTEEGTELRIQYMLSKPRRGRTVVSFAPSLQEQSKKLKPLPANWGRKVARACSNGMPGRLRDAMLGHFPRGRHAWDTTSTLDARGFRDAWLARQRELEQVLGFEVVVVAGRERHHRRLTTRPARPLAAGAARRSMAGKIHEQPEVGEARDARTEEMRGKSARFDFDPKAALSQVDPALFAELVQQFQAEKDGSSSKDQTVELAFELVRRLAHAPVPGLEEDQPRRLREACAYLRKHFKVPIFAEKPAPSFAQKVVLDADGLQTLAYLQREVLPAFRRDLERLPARQLGQGRGRVQQGKIELGRLVMIGIWRLGLVRPRLIYAWLRALMAERPILAQGRNRYMTFRVRCEGKPETMRRTVLLDDFTATYLTIERGFLVEQLLEPFRAAASDKRRRAWIEASIRAYLQAIHAGRERVTFAAMVAAAEQHLMLEGSPLVAAYAAARLDTEDLGDAELRRLAGLAPRAGTSSEWLTQHLVSPPNLGSEDLAPDIVASSGILSALTSHRSRYRTNWLDAVKNCKCGSPIEELLRQFALWLLTRAPVEKRRLPAHEGSHVDDGSKRARSNTHQFPPRDKTHFVNRVRVVGCALLGFVGDGEVPGRIDGDFLRRLRELTRDYFPDRPQHSAWFHFHCFLADPAANHAGFEIGPLGPPPESGVSAKILSAEELGQLMAVVPSRRSGIANESLRTSAHRHVALMSTFGLRRSESANLRTIDLQGSLCRVQEYGVHSLKTAWAERVLPTAFAAPQVEAWMRAARTAGSKKLIDPAAGISAQPDNLFHPLNRLIKDITGDDSFGSHHLRHTLVSSLVLTLLWGSAGLDGLVGDFPWLAGIRVSDDRMRCLLGSEGNAGQGMRAVSALVGHAHPVTTVRHYTHILCIALGGVLRRSDQLDMRRSFENRIASPQTVGRWAAECEAQAAREGATGSQELNRRLREWIERREGFPGVDVDETPLPASGIRIDLGTDATAGDDAIGFDGLERVDRSLRTGELAASDEEVEAVREGLRRLHAIGSGKKGSRVPRHPLQVLPDGTPVPDALPSGLETDAAIHLCDWLEALRRREGETFAWLLSRWVHASERERGRMLLRDAEDIQRARRLADGRRVRIEISEATLSARDKAREAQAAKRMRIKCLDAEGQAIIRDTIAVRWVMSYVVARHWLSG